MSAKKINTRIQQKRDKAANWETAGLNGFIPLAGEIIIYDEGDGSAPKFKVGDGVVQADGKTISGTNINNLPFANVTPAELAEMGYVFDTVIQKIYDEDYTEEAEDLKSIRDIAEEVVTEHNDSKSAHKDIREEIADMSSELTNIANAIPVIQLITWEEDD